MDKLFIYSAKLQKNMYMNNINVPGRYFISLHGGCFNPNKMRTSLPIHLPVDSTETIETKNDLLNPV